MVHLNKTSGLTFMSRTVHRLRIVGLTIINDKRGCISVYLSFKFGLIAKKLSFLVWYITNKTTCSLTIQEIKQKHGDQEKCASEKGINRHVKKKQ